MIDEYCMRPLADGTAVCGWKAVHHTIFRQELHTILVPTIICAAVSVQILGARVLNWWPRLPGAWRLIVPALVAYFAISFREPYDAFAGDSPIKSTIDIVWPMIVSYAFCHWLWWVTPFLGDMRYEASKRGYNRRSRRRRRRERK